MCGGSEVTCPAGPFVLSGAGSATGGGEAPSAPHRSAPRRTRPDLPDSSCRGTQRGGTRSLLLSPVRPGQASAGVEVTRRWDAGWTPPPLTAAIEAQLSFRP